MEKKMKFEDFRNSIESKYDFYFEKEFNLPIKQFYLLICTNDLEIIEISNNFEDYSIVQKIGEPNSIYDKALFLCNKNNNKYILANSSWLSFLNLYITWDS